MLSWLKKLAHGPTNVETLPDVVWRTTAAKYGGIERAIHKHLSREAPPTAILLVAHFPECRRDLETMIAGKSFARPVATALAADLSGAAGATAALSPQQVIDLIVAERHPLPARDDELLAFASRLPCRCRVVHHLALHDALLRRVAGDWVESLLERLGMQEDEAIESSMVSRGIRGAQQKIAQRVHGDRPAESAEEWLDVNGA